MLGEYIWKKYLFFCERSWAKKRGGLFCRLAGMILAIPENRKRESPPLLPLLI